MGDCAKCIHCSSDDVEGTAAKKYEKEENEYYCHDCEKYFTIDWDKQDEIEQKENTLENDADAKSEWENEGGIY